MTVAHIDYETRSHRPIKDGVTPYAKDPTTEIMCLAWAIDDGPVRIWTPDDGGFPQAILDADEVVAHNASFERIISREVLGIKFLPKNMRCSMSRATQSGLPRALERAAGAVTDTPKDTEGRSLMLKMAKPDRKGVYLDTLEARQRLYEYCRQDVIAERELERQLPTPPQFMQRAWGLHEVMNDRGLAIDRSVCEGAVKILDDAILKASAEVHGLTGGAIKTGRQVKKIKAYLNDLGVNIDDLREGTIEETLGIIEDGPAKKLLKLRRASASAAPAKFKKALSVLGDDDRLHDVYVFPGAHTGRAASLGVQVMNLKKAPELFDAWNKALEKHDEKAAAREWDKIQKLVDVIRSGDLETLENTYPDFDPAVLLGKAVRTMVAAPPGKTLVLADLSQIEVRIAHWLSANRRMMTLFAEGGDPYVDFASYFFKTHDVTKAQRQHGKVVVLGANYGLGAARLIVYAKQFGLDLTFDQAKETLAAYRAKYPTIPRLWRALDRAAVQCVLDGKRRRVHLIKMGTEREWFYLEPPSGRRLWYFKPEVVDGMYGPCVEYTNNRGSREQTWGGTFTENLAQAITADIVNLALVRIEEAGLKVVINQHDETGIEVSKDEAKDATAELVNLLEQPPEWSKGLPIAAEAEIKERWLK